MHTVVACLRLCRASGPLFPPRAAVVDAPAAEVDWGLALAVGYTLAEARIEAELTAAAADGAIHIGDTFFAGRQHAGRGDGGAAAGEVDAAAAGGHADAAGGVAAGLAVYADHFAAAFGAGRPLDVADSVDAAAARAGEAAIAAHLAGPLGGGAVAVGAAAGLGRAFDRAGTIAADILATCAIEAGHATDGLAVTVSPARQRLADGDFDRARAVIAIGAKADLGPVRAALTARRRGGAVGVTAAGAGTFGEGTRADSVVALRNILGAAAVIAQLAGVGDWAVAGDAALGFALIVLKDALAGRAFVVRTGDRAVAAHGARHAQLGAIGLGGAGGGGVVARGAGVDRWGQGAFTAGSQRENEDERGGQ